MFDAESMHAAQRVLINSSSKPSLLLLLSTEATSLNCIEHWSCFSWPKEQAALLQLLQNKE